MVLVGLLKDGAGLHATEDNNNLTSHQDFTCVSTKIQGITFLHIISADIIEYANNFGLEDRYSTLKTIPGTCSNQSLIPLNNGQIQMKRLSCDHISNTVILIISVVQEDISYQPGQYIARMCNGDWYVGVITECSNENKDNNYYNNYKNFYNANILEKNLSHWRT